MPHDPSFDSNALVVATDTNYDVASDAYDSSPTKIEPSAGQIAQGVMRPGRQVGAQHFNWLTGQFALILQALINNDVGHELRLDLDEAELANHDARLVTTEDWIANHSPRIRMVEFLASGTLVVPTRCTFALSYGCGGGGAGGGGAAGVNTVDRWMAGGAGGGGSLANLFPLRGLIPGETLNVDVGAGGVAGGIGATGGDGGDTIVRRGTTKLAVHVGAQGGRGSVGTHSDANWVHYTMGGMPVRNAQVMLLGPPAQGIRFDMSTGGSLSIYGNTGATQRHSLYIPMQPGQGGYGTGTSLAYNSADGSMNPVGGFAGGVAGTKGVDGDPNAPPGVVTRRGGGGGGGGGAGPFGPGGDGGDGDAGEADFSNAGTNATANSGAGGGGQGSVGYCDGANFPSLGGTTAGNGGSGRCYFITVQES